MRTKNNLEQILQTYPSLTFENEIEKQKIISEINKSLTNIVESFSRKNSLEVEDLWQECFLVIFNIRVKYEPSQGSLKSFIVKSVRNRIFRYIQAVQRQKVMLLDKKSKAQRLRVFYQNWQKQYGRMPSLRETQESLRWNKPTILKAELEIQRRHSFSWEQEPALGDCILQPQLSSDEKIFYAQFREIIKNCLTSTEYKNLNIAYPINENFQFPAPKNHRAYDLKLKKILNKLKPHFLDCN
ncbi:sigma factor [Gloeothece verrucosa]|uniref:RNA polymerase, sigma 28 subunit, FliA/WhiG subfamily n=1 Tax=Gloeothece verrucosa (strain PCC 7822) TaxID=497965 RepID=E0UM91_GLOV7|nr:sigma factor [Gloeothece verrucosa]ADN18071.1 RNA polymerase, sigma 28 subunit, FliA/WhiG subfamily [Gloeothece verrucosa PCC 7822]